MESIPGVPGHTLGAPGPPRNTKLSKSFALKFGAPGPPAASPARDVSRGPPQGTQGGPGVHVAHSTKFNTSRAKINQTKNKALDCSAPSRCSSMKYGLFMKTLGPHGAPRVPWGPWGSKFWPGGRGPNFHPRGSQGTLGAPWGPRVLINNP